MHKDYLQLSKEGVETEEPASSGSIAEKTDLRSGIHIKSYILKEKGRAFFKTWFQTISSVRMTYPP